MIIIDHKGHVTTLRIMMMMVIYTIIFDMIVMMIILMISITMVVMNAATNHLHSFWSTKI